MADTDNQKEPVETVTPADDKNGGEKTTNTQVEPNSVDNKQQQPFKVFSTQEEFDKHSVGILNSAQKKAEKELLAQLGLKPDEKDKLAKFKEAYDATLSDAEKKANELKTLTDNLDAVKKEVAEKDAIIAAVTKAAGKTTDDVLKYVKMARGLVDENTSIEQALEQVFELTKVEEKKTTVPHGTPPSDSSSSVQTGDNPWKTKDLDKQAEIFKKDKSLARQMYKEVYGKDPTW